MRLPNRENAYLPPGKLTGYLLSETHALGREKARFFRAHGYDTDNATLLEQGLLAIAREGEVSQEIASSHGRKFVVEGTMTTPRGTIINLRTIWLMEPGDERPRFITAYPVKEVRK
jgi:uncharacterized protein DUF6883